MRAVVGLDAGMRNPRGVRAARFRTVIAAAALLVAGANAHAGLFDDDEARKAILDLRTRISQLEDAGKARDSQNAQSQQQLQNALLDLTNQIQQLQQQVAQLRGSNEQLARTVSDLQQHQKDIVQGVNDRLAKVEPQQVNLDGKLFTADPD
jgi:peptidoglycan hydrolase CwlO-like protein